MFKIATLLLTTSLFLSTSVFAGSLADRAVDNAKSKIADFVKVIQLDSAEKERVYKILLAKEQKNLTAKKEHKDDKEAYRKAVSPFNKQYNRQIKDIIGKDKMKQMNKFYKAQKAGK